VALSGPPADNAQASAGRQSAHHVGVDIGGTFTDVASIDQHGRVSYGKVLTTHGRERDGVLAALTSGDVDLAEVDVLVHGTTLVINALLERNGSRAALVTTAGFRDVLELARGSRPESFNWFYHRDAPVVPRHLRFELDERTRASGAIERRPDPDEIGRLATQLRDQEVEAVAVAFLNSYAAPENEDFVADALRELLPGVFVTTSSSLSSAWREYERFSTAAANAYIGPELEQYLDALSGALQEASFTGSLMMMDSNAGALAPTTAKRYPIRLIESGPVGGVIGAARLARANRLENVVTFDMGGTTAKSTFIESEKFAVNDQYWVGGYDTGFPLQAPCIDIIEIGAGGGSIAWIDDMSRLRVGPRSAGSEPGPAAYGLGGEQVTVTDANVFLGRLPAAQFLAEISLHEDAAAKAVATLAGVVGVTPRRLASGVLDLANLSMASLVRKQTLERGRDPRDFCLVAFGGAGPLHACFVAAEVGIRRVLVPPSPGHFSAWGMLGANLRLDRHGVYNVGLDELDVADLASHLTSITTGLRDELAGDMPQLDGSLGHVSVSGAIRYEGQEHAVIIEFPDVAEMPADLAERLRAEFLAEYERTFAHTNPSSRIEISELIVGLEYPLTDGRAQGTLEELTEEIPAPTIVQVYFDGDDTTPTTAVHRASLAIGQRLAGPALVYEEGSLTVIPPDASVEVLEDGCLMADLDGYIAHLAAKKQQNKPRKAATR
jgi:N-methylhydantoinase A